MKNICVIYGSSTGTCQGLAEKIGQQLGVQDDGIIDVQNLSADVVNKYDVLILGTSTWIRRSDSRHLHLGSRRNARRLV